MSKYTGSASEVRVTDNGLVLATVTVGGGVYDSASFAIPTGTTNYDLGLDTSSYKATGNIFNNILNAFFLEFVTDQTVSIYLNAITNDPIILTAGDSPWKDAHIKVTKLFITNTSGATANIKTLTF
jgi:hypothetical protein